MDRRTLAALAPVDGPGSCFQDDLRVDGRGCEDYRHMEIETDVVSNTDGSAKVTLVMTARVVYRPVNVSQ